MLAGPLPVVDLVVEARGSGLHVSWALPNTTDGILGFNVWSTHFHTLLHCYRLTLNTDTYCHILNLKCLHFYQNPYRYFA